jgi:hypothetical protein
MLTPEDAQYLTEAVAGLAAPLYEALESGRTTAHDHYDNHEMKGIGYTKGRTDLTRDHARKHLEMAVDLGGWALPPKGRSGRLGLYKDALTLKVLHGVPMTKAPSPGRNQARISYWQNPRVTLYGVEASNLLAVWSHDTSGTLSVRIVRPLTDWKYGQAPVVDLDFLMPRTAEDFGTWEFTPDDKGLNLPFTFDEESEEGESSGA